MKKTPKALRLHLGIFGRTNVGKSSLLNFISGQDVAIISELPGTTTDVVEKTMELLPIGPVIFLDTAGLDDVSALAPLRIARTKKIFDRTDIVLLVIEPNLWGDYEEEVIREAAARKIAVVGIVNKTDLAMPTQDFLTLLSEKCSDFFLCSSVIQDQREALLLRFKQSIMKVCPAEFLMPSSLLGDLLSPGASAIFIVPIDLQAPRGRLILPQVQAIRDVLDNDASVLVVKEREYAHALNSLRIPPELVVCDSQVVLKMVADTPSNIPCTTFSILFSRLKGDLIQAVEGLRAFSDLKRDDKILIAEACSHHPIEDDIGRVKIPRWIRQFLGFNITIDIANGYDWPENLADYKLIIHCGACMLTRKQMCNRLTVARTHEVFLTNYGLSIAYLQGVLERVLSPFPRALSVCKTFMP